jgi:hypothetical protein
MIDTMKTYGVDSFVGRLACIFQGSADTTFYIVALYFGSVGIRKTRYAISCGLIADLAGVIAAISVAYLFFGLTRTRMFRDASLLPSPALAACAAAPAQLPEPVTQRAAHDAPFPEDAVSVLVLRGDQTICRTWPTAHAAGLDHEAGDDPDRPRASWARCSAAAPNCARSASSRAC